MKPKHTINFIAAISILLLCTNNNSFAKRTSREYYQLIVYHYKNAEQEKVLDNYLQKALLPAMHEMHIDRVGAFKALSNDTAADKLLYVFLPFASLDKMRSVWNDVEKNTTYQTAGSEYNNAVFKNPPYTRMETILLYAFPLAPKMQMPQLASAMIDTVYELRIYESATEKIFQNKVKMFNECC